MEAPESGWKIQSLFFGGSNLDFLQKSRNIKIGTTRTGYSRFRVSAIFSGVQAICAVPAGGRYGNLPGRTAEIRKSTRAHFLRRRCRI